MTRKPSPRAETTLDDNALLDLVQRQTLRYFWDSPTRLRPRARAQQRHCQKYGLECVTTGGSGFGHGDHRRRLPRLDRPRRGRRPHHHDDPLPAEGRQLPRHHAALPQRRHRARHPLQPQGRRQRPRRDLVPRRRPALHPPVLRRQDRARGQPARRHRLVLARSRVELAHPRRPQRPLLALEPEQRLEHEPRDPRLERVPDHLRPGRQRPRFSISPDVYHRGWADGRAFLNGRT